MDLGKSNSFWNRKIKGIIRRFFKGFLFVIITSNLSYAQEGFNNWSLGFRGGSSIAKMNIGSKILPVYGFNIRYAASPYVAIQGNFDTGQFKSVNPINDVYGRTFKNDYFQYSITGNINLLRLLNVNGLSKRVSFYGLLGVGQIFNNVKTTINTNVTDYIAYEGHNNKETSIFAVSGAGLRFNINPRFDFFMQYEYTYTGSAYIDGYNYSSHLNKDRYTFLSSGISIKLGKKNKPDADWETSHSVWQGRFSTYENQIRDIRKDFIKLNDSYQARLASLELEQNNLKATSENSKQTFLNLSQEIKEASKIKKIISDSGIENQMTILFAFDSDKILPQADIILSHMVKNLIKYPEITVKILGYADSTGSVEYNNKLSKRRAYAIYNYLKDNKIDSKRISLEGLGEYNPLATNKSILGRVYNRRVEIILMR